MAAIPVDELLVHLHGDGSELSRDVDGKSRPTGGGSAMLDITRTSDGQVSVSIKFMFRTFEFKVSQKEWDATTEETRRVEFFAGYDEGFNSSGEGNNAECRTAENTEATYERGRNAAWKVRLAGDES